MRCRRAAPRAPISHPPYLRVVRDTRLPLLLLLLLVSAGAFSLRALACPLPGAQCKAQCASLAGWGASAETRFDAGTRSGDPRLRVFLGRKNRHAATLAHGDKPQLFVNFDVYPNIGTGPEAGLLMATDTSKARSLPQCCRLCASTLGCLGYHWYSREALSRAASPASGSKALKDPSGLVKGKQCYLLKGGSNYDMADGVTSPQAGGELERAQYRASWVGGWSRPISSDMDDPHILDDPDAQDAQHADFHFSGVRPQSANDVCNKIYTLLADERLCINVKLGGCSEAGSSGQVAQMRSSSGTPGLIKEIGLVWSDDFRIKHTFRMTARAGSVAGLARGYLTGAEFDGQDLPVPLPHDRFLSGKLRVTRTGAADAEQVVDGAETFELSLEGLVRLRLVLFPVVSPQGSAERTSVRIKISVLNYQASRHTRGVLAYVPGQAGSHVAPDDFEVEGIFSTPQQRAVS